MSRMDDLVYTLELELEDKGKKRMQYHTVTGWSCVMEYHREKDHRHVTKEVKSNE